MIMLCVVQIQRTRSILPLHDLSQMLYLREQAHKFIHFCAFGGSLNASTMAELNRESYIRGKPTTYSNFFVEIKSHIKKAAAAFLNLLTVQYSVRW